MPHHAFLYRVKNHQQNSSVDKIINSFGLNDIVFVQSDTFGIAESRQVIKLAYGSPVNSLKRLIVVKFRLITSEAQNALLKILEEPPTSTVFSFFAPKDCSIIPTLQSRFVEIIIEEEESISGDFTEFYSSGYKERLDLIVKKLEKPDLDWVDTIKIGLAQKLQQDILHFNPRLLKSLSFVIEKLNTRGCSNKLLLEELALTLPLGKEK